MAEGIPENKKIAPYMAAFLIHPMQMGVGILSFQAIIVRDAGYDSWIAVLLAGIGASVAIWFIYAILNKNGGSLITVHRDVLGKWFGGALSLIWILFFFFKSVMIIRSYTEIVQVWMFPEIKTWVVSLMILSLVSYTILGGFRSVIGMCFFGFFVPLLGIFPVIFPLIPNGNYHNFLPIMTHTIPELMHATQDMSLSMMGFGVLLIAYPFILKPRSSQKWAHVSNMVTIFLYGVIAVISFAFFNEEILKDLIWPTLSMLKIVHFSFLERFEYFAICLWFLTIFPNALLTLWPATRGAKVLFHCKQKHALVVFAFAAFVLSSFFFLDRPQVNQLNNMIGNIGLYLLLLYLPLLWIVQHTVIKVRKKA